ncbi:MAG: D-alanine--D-alanine ligase, partial [Elusimicrobia bacterium]|nr:D-alanine--D-alanine ligase [Elusimicrobiota bacterium]
PASPQKFAQKIDVMFPILHGTMGEDGTVQGLFEVMDTAYIGCGVLSSAVGMDKDICKTLADNSGIPVLEHIILNSQKGYKIEDVSSWCERAGYPVFVKPVYLGSSVGVTKVKSLSGLPSALAEAFRYDTAVMVEKAALDAREITVAVFGEGANIVSSACGEIKVFNHEFYDYDAKYIDPNGMKLELPADISPAAAEKMRKMSVRIFEAVRGCGMARVDFLLGQDGNFYFCEINTSPGFTSHSLYPKLMSYIGVPPSKVIDGLIEMALKRKKLKDSLCLVP